MGSVRGVHAAALMVLAGCASPAWLPAAGAYRARDGYVIELPEGWMRRVREGPLVVTRDGMSLQEIEITRLALGRPLSKGGVDTITGDMTPEEVAEALVGRLRREVKDGTVEVEVHPGTLSGERGFRASIEISGDRLRVRAVLYGAIVGDACYALLFQAPRRHYFDRDLPAFEAAVRTFRVDRAPAPARSAGEMTTSGAPRAR